MLNRPLEGRFFHIIKKRSTKHAIAVRKESDELLQKYNEHSTGEYVLDIQT